MALSLVEKANAGIFSEDCDDTTSNVFIAGKHAVQDWEYDQMIKAFFGSVPSIDEMEHRVITQAELQQSCVVNCVLFNFNAFVKNNTDINVSISPHPATDTPEGALITGKYSIHLFRGLQHLYNPDQYVFCKARTVYKGQIVTTLALAVIKDGNTVYRGDLTNMYP